MSETWTKTAFFNGVQTRSHVRIQLCRRKLSQNTLLTLGSRPIFPTRSGCQTLEKSPKSPTFSSCFLLCVFPKFSQDVLVFSWFRRQSFLTSFFSFSSFVPSFHKQSPTLTELAKNSKFWHSSSFSILRKKQDILSSNNAKVNTKH